MTAFFIRTDRAVAGPFTGVELREAALAGIIGPAAIIGGGPQGPWYQVSDVGLFSDKKTPLPHPPGTDVPQYHVRGMPGAFQGPFKLRELIGFAARGMLPADALLQSDTSDDWIAACRFRVLAACLNGDLVLLDASGKVVLRSDSSVADASQTPPTHEARAPIEVARPVSLNDATAVAPAVSETDSESVDTARWRQGSVSPQNEAVEVSSRFAERWARIRDPFRGRWKFRFSLRPRLVIQLACLVIVFAGVASAFSLWKRTPLQRDRVIGDWIAFTETGESMEPQFGISLKQDGACVLFNGRGRSWTGDFEWAQRTDQPDGFESMTPFSTVFDQIDPQHEAGIVEPTDGYIRFRGFVKDPPMIDGHPVRDLFLRRDGGTLRIGYLASVRWTQDSKTMEAGWMTAEESRAVRPDVAAELSAIEKELPVPTDEFGGERPQHVSEAISLAFSQASSSRDKNEDAFPGSLAYSNQVNAAYLLSRFGVPDEARTLYPFEIPRLRSGPTFEGAQMVRYGDLKLILSSEGRLRYVTVLGSSS